MAEDQDENQEAGAEAEAGAKGGKKKLIMLIVVGLVLVGLSVGGTLVALTMMGGEEDQAIAEGEAGAAEEAEPELAPAIYYPLKPTIIVNFNARGRQRFLQADVSLMVRENDVVAAIEQHSTMLQHSLLMLFSAQDYSELQTPEGKELLRQLALEEMQTRLQQEMGKPGVEQVLFTNFVMQ